MRSVHNDDVREYLVDRPETTAERRRHGRVRVDHTTCDELGRVLDISASGMKVARKRGKLYPPGQEFMVRVAHLDAALWLPARIVRSSKQKGLGAVHALEFRELNAAQRRELNRLVAGAWNMLTVAAR